MINSNKNEIIFLNGYEAIKIVQMYNDYCPYNILGTIKDDNNNISWRNLTFNFLY